jgi:hypothetical protein
VDAATKKAIEGCVGGGEAVRKVTTMAGPQPLYYLAIDGTEAQDSAVFGALLEGRGGGIWRRRS